MPKFLVVLMCTLICPAIAAHTQAAILLSKHSADASAIAQGGKSFPNNVQSPSLQVQVASFKRMLDGDSGGTGRKSHYGILSLSVIGIFLLGAVALATISPELPAGLAALPMVSAMVTAVLAIIFGRLGVKRDNRKGFAIAGLAIGLITITLMCLISLLLLALTGTVIALF